MRNTKILALVEAAAMIALATILSLLKVVQLPQGGSVTAVSMLPLIILALRRGPVWGIGSGLIYAFIQLLLHGGLASPVPTFGGLMLELLFDYLLAFGVLGLAGFFRKTRTGLLISIPLCIGLRLLSHTIAGVVVWGSYAPEGVNIWWYSFLYNGSYMGLELVFTLVVAFLLGTTVPRLITPHKAS